MRRVDRISLIIIGLILLLAGVGTIAGMWGVFRGGQESMSWSEAKGVVVKGFVDVGTHTDKNGYRSTTYFPKLSYRFETGSRTLTGEDTAPDAPSGAPTKENAASALAEYPAGTTLTVYYDAADPRRSKLQRGAGMSSGAIGFFVLMGVLLCGGGVVCVWVARRPAQSQPETEA